MIPVPGSPNVLVSYQELLVHEDLNEREILIPDLRTKVSVRALLDGVEDFSSRVDRRERDLKQRTYEMEHPSFDPAWSKNKPLGSLMSFVLGFVVLLTATVGAAVAISRWASVTAGITTGLIIIGTLLLMGVVGAMQLRNDNRISESSFVQLMIESYRRLPLLRASKS